MATNNFGIELADHACKENHGNTRRQEDIDDPIGKTPKFNAVITSVSSSAKFDDENDQNDHELTAEKVSLKVVALVDDRSTPV